MYMYIMYTEVELFWLDSWLCLEEYFSMFASFPFTSKTNIFKFQFELQGESVLKNLAVGDKTFVSKHKG